MLLTMFISYQQYEYSAYNEPYDQKGLCKFQVSSYFVLLPRPRVMFK